MFFKKKLSYKLDIPPHLIQSIRIYQALMEAGLTVSIDSDQKSTFDYLSRFYPVKYVVEDPKARSLDVGLSHQEPFVKIGNHRQPLLFPKNMFAICKNLWPQQRKIDFLFVGLVTPQRKSLLEEWFKLLEAKYPRANTVIEDSRRGRDFPEKSWDQGYYQQLANAKFSLCPNGDYVWTYRFFESALCGAIPIVQDECPQYRGFEYFKMGDSQRYEWSKDIAEHNFKKARELLGPPRDLKKLLGA